MSGVNMPNRPDFMAREIEEVRSIFGDLPIIEAKADFVVYINTDDRERGIPGDPKNCLFSVACRRAFGSHGVLFYPSVAYVDMLDPKDNSRRIVMKFHLPAAMRKRLEQFDQGTAPAKEATFVLKAVPPSRTLKARKKTSDKYRKRRKAGLVVDPGRQERAQKAAETRRSKRLMGIRSGSGQIHTREKAAAEAE